MLNPIGVCLVVTKLVKRKHIRKIIHMNFLTQVKERIVFLYNQPPKYKIFLNWVANSSII